MDVHAAPPLVQNSVTGEHVVAVALTVVAAVIAPVVIVLPLIGTGYNAGFPPLSPQTHRCPVGLVEVEVK